MWPLLGHGQGVQAARKERGELPEESDGSQPKEGIVMLHGISHDTPKDGEPNAPATSGQPASQQGNKDGRYGPLEEFKALRQEIECRRKIQRNWFALQLTAAGVIFSFALSASGRAEFLLIIPISSFVLCIEYADQENGINIAAKYIRKELDWRVPGGLNWESWLHNPENVSQRSLYLLRQVATMVAFPVIALAALAWVAADVFSSGYRLSNGVAVAGGLQAVFIIIWIMGLVGGVLNVVSIFHIDGKPLRNPGRLPPVLQSLCSPRAARADSRSRSRPSGQWPCFKV